MALEGAELAELKDSVPPQFKPQEHDAITPAFQERTADAGAADLVANVALDLSVEQPAEAPDAEDAPVVQPVNAPDAPDEDETRGDPVQAVHEQEREQTLRDLNIGMKDMADGQDDRNLNTGRIARIVSGGSENAAARREKERRRRGGDISTQLLLQQQLENQIAANNEQITRNNERLEVLDRYQSGLERHLEKLKNGEAIERNEDGSLKDADAETAIREHEEKYGVTVDRTDADKVQNILSGYQQEDQAIRRDNERLEAKNSEYTALGRELDRNPNDPGVRARIERELQSDSGTRGVAKASAEATTTQAKEVVHSQTTSTADADALSSELLAEQDVMAGEIDPFAAPTGGSSASFANSLDAPPITGDKLSTTFGEAVSGNSDAAAPDADHQIATAGPANIPSNIL